MSAAQPLPKKNRSSNGREELVNGAEGWASLDVIMEDVGDRGLRGFRGKKDQKLG